jgi:hypothetical protein
MGVQRERAAARPIPEAPPEQRRCLAAEAEWGRASTFGRLIEAEEVMVGRLEEELARMKALAAQLMAWKRRDDG